LLLVADGLMLFGSSHNNSDHPGFLRRPGACGCFPLSLMENSPSLTSPLLGGLALLCVTHLRTTLWTSVFGCGVLLRSLSNQTPRSTSPRALYALILNLRKLISCGCWVKAKAKVVCGVMASCVQHHFAAGNVSLILHAIQQQSFVS